MKKIKSLTKTVFMLTLSVIILVQPISVSAATYSGKCGDNVTWSFNSSTGALTISGTGAMDDYKSSSKPGYYSYSSSIKTITISSGVTTIGNYAFYWCNYLTSISIPSSVTSIGNYAFDSCRSLTSITIPSGVTSIGYDAFSYCRSLTSVTISNSVATIGTFAFYECSSLTNITVDSANQKFSSQNGILFDKNKTKIIKYPSSKSETSYTIPSSVTVIDMQAFDDCTNLTSIIIPNSVTYIYSSAFSRCTNLTGIIIPNSVISISSYVFSGCTNLTSITIPSSVTSIADYTFEDCSNLTSITIPNSVTSIGKSAFFECTNLTSITIPGSVTSIGEYAFGRCTSLTGISVNSSNQYYSSQDGVLFNKDKTELTQYPLGNTRTSYTIPGSVTSISKFAFSYCNSLKKITIPNSVTSMPEAAFRNCESLTDVSIGNNVTSIPDYAFDNCASLTNVSVGKGVKSIGYQSFDGCTNLTSISIPYGVLSIGGSAFDGCASLKNVEIPSSVTSIGGSAFDGCSNITSISIPNGVTSIGSYTFYGCTSMESIMIPSSVTSIGNSAFNNCDKLYNVYYGGTNSQWNSIEIGNSNSRIKYAKIFYNHYGSHSYTSKTTTSTYLKSAATCTSPAVYYYKCSKCSEKGTNTYTYGSALGHRYTSKTTSAVYLKSKATCTSPEVYYYKCFGCSKKGTNTYTYGSALGHSYKTTITKATTSKNGKKVQKCSRCSTSKTTTIYYPKTIKLSATVYTYNGNVKKPSVTVKDSKGNKIAASNYTVSYSSGCEDVGQYTVTVKFKGNYSGTVKKTFTIQPKGTDFIKRNPTQGKLGLQWKKVSGITGYQIQISKSSNFSKNTKTINIPNQNTVKTIEKVSRKTIYYCRIRTYKTVKVNGKSKNIYSSWSKTRSVKTT